MVLMSVVLAMHGGGEMRVEPIFFCFLFLGTSCNFWGTGLTVIRMHISQLAMRSS